ncbi:hypothetical protein [Pseudomonas putida]|uniref:hypothetical protein n=1 Tax=Pseudomonas putida TaxID=303 RepID=UPI002B250035|nr:hypothetical protein [Pseudomonas putida]
MEDRELLDLAAKAAGMPPLHDEHGIFSAWVGDSERGHWWNPLEDDGDALRLAADLCINIEWFPGMKFVQTCRFGIGEIIGWVDERGRSVSLRRAITVAAAKIGKAMQEKH